MDKLYRQVKIDSFEQIRAELSSFVTDEAINNNFPSSWMVNPSKVLSSCPNLFKFCNEHIKKPIIQVKFYASPSGNPTGPHIDGSSVPSVRRPFSLALPIANSENTFMNWYEDDLDNLRIRKFDKEVLPTSFNSSLSEVLVPLDKTKLKLIGSLEIVKPTFTRTDLMHDVTNNTGSTRIVAVLRWRHDYKIEEIISEDLLLD